MTRTLAFVLLVFAALMTWPPNQIHAQGCGPANPNCIVPTAPIGTNDNRAASTAFVQQAVPLCNVKVQGALGNGTTDDTPAFNLCRTALHMAGGGILLVPPANGAYCLSVGFSTNSSDTVVITGAGRQIALSDCNNDVTTVTLQGSNSSISNITIKGRGADTTDTFTITHPALLLASNCVNCVVSHVTAIGGFYAIEVIGGGQWLLNDVSATEAYGDANIYAIAAVNGGITTGWIWRSFADDSLPTGTGPTSTAGSYTIAAWSANHAFAANAVVTNGSYRIQCMNCDGVKQTGGSAPTNPVFGVSVVDNQVSWRLVEKAGSCAITLDSGNEQTVIFQTDAASPRTHNICILNTQGWIAPNLITIQGSSPAGALSDNIFVNAGNAINVVDNNPIDFCYVTSCAGIQFSASFGQGALVANNLLFGGSYGVIINSGASAGKSNIDVSHNRLFGYSSTAILVQPNITDFTIDANICGSSTAYGTNAQCYATSTGDDYEIITNNNTHGSTNASSPANGAGSAHSTVTGNL